MRISNLTFNPLIVLFLLSFSSNLIGQEKYQQKEADILKEKKAIETAVLGYIENFFENDIVAMQAYLHPELSKGGISKKRGATDLFYEKMPMERLKKMMETKKPLVRDLQKNEVKILDVFRNTASVRLETGYPNKMRWIEYIHLSKTNGKWLVNNVLWDYYPMKKKKKKKGS
jgi:hypothetical protein